ncbi:alkaline phosphatase [Cellvibrio sp.]|uniref:alkaline phosphatase n=1 Tax=Cellvibrio sp. TaxID=1965322 RepID=UPI00396478D5
MRTLKKLALAVSVCFASQLSYGAESDRTNIIFLIGDGMGVAYTSAYRLFQDNLATPELDKTIFDEMLVGMATTYPDDHNQVTDSAAAATALATGIKTFNGAIGVDAQHQPVISILDKARELGYLTGVAVTCQVNHATPAAFIAHSDSRQSYEAIADQYIDLKINGKPKVDLIFGGGQEYFVRKDRDLVKEFEAQGYKYIDDINKLRKVKKLPALGLFSTGGLTPAVESDHPLRLAEMTQKSLELLTQKSAHPKPFLLMLEASQIDWCGHANDIACAMGEMRDMAETMKIIKQFIDANPNTILVATADHSTGGLSLGAKGRYQWEARVVRNIKATAPSIARQLLDSKANWKTVWQSLTQIKLAEDEQKAMDALIVQANENNQEFISGQVTAQVLTFFDKYTSTGWTTKGHTGEDVQIFSYGKGKETFQGAMDNTDIAKKLFTYLK